MHIGRCDLYSWFAPKNLQKDSCGLTDLPKFTDYTLEQLDSLVHSPLTEETFKNKVDSIIQTHFMAFNSGKS